ncbi:hypothetical protein BZA05DRAFT_401479 [Tricharina praecox]|uniref:uncharacterized protein n=1 Tax=Tricharina praecox TaxID=43433 RepID=UPI00221F38DC|nr:uncharacterized protein BZA05DRAFT_401479 [Tricharina praecox]KAI5849762.1 hypothetical protein BZA05DRAFT_401479 [Tricharina praecox]
MSTFKGVLAEFPDIRVDYFRPSSSPADKPPLACFLSHIHSDHVQGLEGAYNAPFIYCSVATKELLIRLQRKTHRLNLQRGVIETSHCHYREKTRLLKTIPLDTPTEVEVGPGRTVRVTLIDANHCVGAVIFLFEGDGKAILYTGDIRAEAWWVEYIARHPVLLPYSTGVKRLDMIYLDTSCAAKGLDKFSSKREGVADLLRQLDRYPTDTIFHLNTWTFGYEEVWVTLASYFKSQIHLSPYHYKLFKSVQWAHGSYLAGFTLGNSEQAGILTTNPAVRIHSCERGLECPGLKDKMVVYITPAVAMNDGVVYQEEGVEWGDLSNDADFSILGQFQLLLDMLGDSASPEIRSMLLSASRSRKEAVPLRFDDSHGEAAFTKDGLLCMLSAAAVEQQSQHNHNNNSQWQPQPRNWPGTEYIAADNGEMLPAWVQFPYARHSSLTELRSFVAAFRPKDVHQCVIDEATWTPRDSVQHLFGKLCSGSEFRHDREMMRIYRERTAEQTAWQQRLRDMEAESQVKMLAAAGEAGEATQQLMALDALVKAEAARDEAEHREWLERKRRTPVFVTPSPPAKTAKSERPTAPTIPRTPSRIMAPPKCQPDSEADAQLIAEDLRTPASSKWRKPKPQVVDEEIFYLNNPSMLATDDDQELPESQLESARVEEAFAAAVGIGGKSWWAVELESTRRNWRYQREEEL